jgi:HEPN domain-containing protein
MTEIPQPLISDISEGKCLPFIGAGFSMNAKLPPDMRMPDWYALAQILSREANTENNLSPPVIAQQYERRFGRVQLIESIRKTLHPGQAKPGLAHRSFVTLPFDTIYTTNFDLLLEDAYDEIGRPFRSLVGELQLPFHAGQTASSIIKMHGDLRHEEHITVTQKDYEQFLDKYPVVATHLSSMLITRTPLFLGYSLSDPDFQNIRNVVRSRLGQFERMAYIIQFNRSSDDIENALDDKLHIISLNITEGKSRDDLLSALFNQILDKLDVQAGIEFRNSRPDVFEPINMEVVEKAIDSEDHPILETTSNLCFVMMPLHKDLEVVYRNLIVPAVEQFGLKVVRSDEINASGFIVEQIRVAIQQSRLCFAVISNNNPNVMYELGLAQANGKPTILLAQDTSDLPFDIASQRVVKYGDNPAEAIDSLSTTIQNTLTEDYLKEAKDLLNRKYYRASIAASAVILEHSLRNLIKTKEIKNKQILGINQMIKILGDSNIIDVSTIKILLKASKIRNNAVHNLSEQTRADAEFVYECTEKFLVYQPLDQS